MSKLKRPLKLLSDILLCIDLLESYVAEVTDARNLYENYSSETKPYQYLAHVTFCCGAVGPIFSFFILCNRHAVWPKKLALVLFLVGVGGIPITLLSLQPIGLEYLLLVLFFSFLFPLTFIYIEDLCRKLSKRIQGRDYILWLRGSAELENEYLELQFWRRDVRTTWLDALISMGLVILIIGLSAVPFFFFSGLVYP